MEEKNINLIGIATLINANRNNSAAEQYVDDVCTDLKHESVEKETEPDLATEYRSIKFFQLSAMWRSSKY